MRALRGSFAWPRLLLGACLAFAGPLAAAPAQLALAHQRLELPGVPVLTLAVDLDRDGRRDLAVVVASTSWGEVGIEEPMQVDDEGTFVDVLTVVPTVLDRRELLLFRGTASGYAAEALRFELPTSVHAVAAGPPAAPLVAWTDDGVAEIVLAGGATAEGSAVPELALVPRVAARTIFAGSTSFLARSGLIDDLDGDGDADLLVPVAGGLEVHLSTPEGVSATAASLVTPPETKRRRPPSAAGVMPSRSGGARTGKGRSAVRVLLPQVVDLNGDHRPDLLYRDTAAAGDGVRVRLGLGEGRFGAAFDPLPGWSETATPSTPAPAADQKDAPSREVVWLGDLDGDGQAEVVTSEDIPNAKDSMRAELAEAKRPNARIRVHALGTDGRWTPAPKAEFTVEGYVFEGGGGDDDEGDGEGMGFSLPPGYATSTATASSTSSPCRSTSASSRRCGFWRRSRSSWASTSGSTARGRGSRSGQCPTSISPASCACASTVWRSDSCPRSPATSTATAAPTSCSSAGGGR